MLGPIYLLFVHYYSFFVLFRFSDSFFFFFVFPLKYIEGIKIVGGCNMKKYLINSEIRAANYRKCITGFNHDEFRHLYILKTRGWSWSSLYTNATGRLLILHFFQTSALSNDLVNECSSSSSRHTIMHSNNTLSISRFFVKNVGRGLTAKLFRPIRDYNSSLTSIFPIGPLTNSYWYRPYSRHC